MNQETTSPTTELVQITDPNTGKTFYANTVTGECSWDLPENARVRPRDPNGIEWWELFDESSDSNYYYNTSTHETEWSRPTSGIVVSLTAIQKSAIGKAAFGGSSYTTSSQEKLTTESKRESLLRSSATAAPDVEPVSVSSPVPPAPPAPPMPQSNSSGADRLGRTSTSSPAISSENLHGEHTERGRASTTGFGKLSFTRVSQNSLAAQKARTLGISNPTLDSEAAAAMNPLNSTNLKKSSSSLPSAGQDRGLPSSLKDDISQFKIDGFAKKYFSQHRQGLFQRKVPIEKMLGFQKEPIKAPLLNLNQNLHKDALKCFKHIQKIMSVKNGDLGSAHEEIGPLVEKGLRFAGLRDEIYVQLCKQLINNPSQESVFNGWILMDILTSSFPPSKNLEAYLQNFLVESREKVTPGEKLHTIIKHSVSGLAKIMKAGPRGRTLNLAEIEQCLSAPFINSVFGDALENIMERQRETDPTNHIPNILSFLVDGILKLNGARTEGIFRVPGDVEGVSDLRCRIDKDQYNLEGITDPNVPGSLLKLWLRELSEPLIPAEFYAACISVGASDGRIPQEELLKQAIEILEILPATNKKVVYYMLKFLQVVAEPQNQPITKMTVANLAMVFAPNFLRCPSDNPTTIFENTKFEQAFLRALILGHLPDKS